METGVATKTAHQCPGCSRNKFQGYLRSGENFVYWCPCGMVYIQDEERGDKTYPIYSFYDHLKK